MNLSQLRTCAHGNTATLLRQIALRQDGAVAGMARPSVAILGLHDKTVVFRLSMQCKIEDVVPDGLAQVEIAIPGNEFVGQCLAAGDNFPGGRDDAAAPD